MRRDMRSRRMRDMRRERRRDYAMGSRRMSRDREHYSRIGDMSYPRYEDEAYRRDSQYDREYDRNYDYRYGDIDYRGRRDYRRGRDYRYDYGYDYADGLDDEELMEWSKELLEGVEPQMKQHFTKEAFERKVKDMGISYDKYDFSELYTTTLMLYDDYKKTLGTGSIDTYIRLAKDWLEDEDAELKYGEKLATYYDEIVCAEEQEIKLWQDINT